MELTTENKNVDADDDLEIFASAVQGKLDKTNGGDYSPIPDDELEIFASAVQGKLDESKGGDFRPLNNEKRSVKAREDIFPMELAVFFVLLTAFIAVAMVIRYGHTKGCCPPDPTLSPTTSPTLSPTLSPTAYPTAYPTASPTASPIFINTPEWRDQGAGEPAWGTRCLLTYPFANDPPSPPGITSQCDCKDYAVHSWCVFGACATLGAPQCKQFGADTHCSDCGGKPRVFHNIHEGNAEFDRLERQGPIGLAQTNLLANSCKVTIPPQNNPARNPNKFKACFSPYNYRLNMPPYAGMVFPGKEYRNAHSVAASSMPLVNPEYLTPACPGPFCSGSLAERFVATCEVKVTDVLTTIDVEGDGYWYAYLVDESSGAVKKCGGIGQAAQCGEIDYSSPTFTGMAADVREEHDRERLNYAHAWDHKPVSTATAGGKKECKGWGTGEDGDYLTHSGTDAMLSPREGMRYCSIVLGTPAPATGAVQNSNIASTMSAMGSSRPPKRWRVEPGDVFRWFQNSNNKDGIGTIPAYQPLVGFKICI